jgi:hypothetical protein
MQKLAPKAVIDTLPANARSLMAVIGIDAINRAKPVISNSG